MYHPFNRLLIYAILDTSQYFTNLVLMRRTLFFSTLIFYGLCLLAQETEPEARRWTYLDTVKQKQVRYRKDVGKKDGIWTAWYKKGVKMAEGEYMDGQKTSEWIMWHRNGRLMAKGYYKKGKKEGKWVEWRSDSTLLSESYYKNGKKHGRSRTWHKNWVGKSECQYFNGLLNDKYKEWDENGNLIKEAIYKMGDIKEEVIYHNEKGREKTQ